MISGKNNSRHKELGNGTARAYRMEGLMDFHNCSFFFWLIGLVAGL